MKKIVFSGAFLLFLIGCTVGPDYHQPIFFSDKQLEKALDLKPYTAQHLPFHPLDFHDETLTLLMKKAVQNAPTVRLAVSRVRQARQSVKIAAASLAPTLDLTANRTYEKESKNMGLAVDEDFYQLGFDVSWEIDIWGANRRRLEQAEAQEKAAFESLKNVYVSLLAETARLYVDLRMQEELLQKARENVNLQNETYQLVKDKFETGLTGGVNVNQAKYLVESTQASVPKLKDNIQSDINALAVLLGEMPQNVQKIVEQKNQNLVKRSFNYPIEKLKELPVNTVRNRPDVRVAEENLIGQNAAVGAAVAALYPNVSISAFFGLQAVHSSDIFEKNSYGYSILPKLTQPVFHFGALKNNVALQKLIKEEYEIQYEQQLLNAVQEIRNALSALENEVRANRFYQSSYRQIAKAAELLRDRYKNGLIEYSEVLDSEQRRVEAQTNVIQSNAALYQNITAFYKAVGGEVNTAFDKY